MAGTEPTAAKLLIPPAALAAQARSSDAAASVWVSANAGSGKTHVLTERVIRLLLRGTKPARILCLTYTKAAASVMQSRVFSRLARWTSLAEADLQAELTKLEGSPPDAVKLNQARRLFALALETPGGLKIQTIHAFCESLLHQFPLEANIAGHFELMDDAAAKACMDSAKKQFLTEIYNNPASPQAEAFRFILAKAGEFSFDKLLDEAVTRKQELKTYAGALSADNGAKLNQILGLEQAAKLAQARNTDIESALAAELKRAALFDPADLAKLAELGGARARDFADKLKSAAAETDTARLADTVSAAYFSKGGIKNAARLFTQKALAAWPALEALFSQKAEAAQEITEALKNAALKDLNLAAYRLTEALLARYGALKQARGLMDFSDLISSALALLQRRGAGQWVQYKLDKGIDHILVDEAQDTGPEQWAIIRLLSQDFFSGLGAREDLNRTIFAVGDEKQSIYSFQGASPRDFAANGRLAETKARYAGRLFTRQNLAFSFRSTADVLAAVDRVFALPQNYRGLSDADEPTIHDAIRLNDEGYVDIWQPFVGAADDEPQDWTEALDKAESPAAMLAETISKTIGRWLRDKEFLPGKNRPVASGDILILVRRRDEFVHALAKELKNAAIPAAGADRLRLTDHIAVRDLMAIGDFVLQPRDDLALAAALKSPLFTMSEEELLFLAAPRSGTLWEALREKAESDKNAAAIAEKLHRWRSFADIRPVYEFYSKILAEDGGRRQFLRRLGHEAADILDAFLDYCLESQKTGLPGLQIFLQNLRETSPEIKREQDQARNEVRIMTVHAAKGQEAPIVFLIDNGSAVWHSSHAPCLLPLPLPPAVQKQSGLPPQIRLWLPKAEYKTRLTEHIAGGLKAAAEEEYRRLLYVGMTRAEDRLIVCGFCGAKEPEDSWLPLIRGALAEAAEPVAYPEPAVQAVRFCRKKSAGGAAHAAQAAAAADNIAPLPAFLSQKPPEEPALPRPLAPSGAASVIETEPETNPERMTDSPILPERMIKAETATEAGAAKAKTEKMRQNLPGAMERGTLIHDLLQYLPAFPANERQKPAEAYLAARLGADNGAAAEEILRSITTVLEDKRFAPLFTENGRSEVALMGLVRFKGQQRAVSGQIDRLVFADSRIIFADYKTGRPPTDEKDIPAIYKMQLALYAELLFAIYPDKKIEALLIYTQNSRLFSFSREDLLPLLA